MKLFYFDFNRLKYRLWNYSTAYIRKLGAKYFSLTKTRNICWMNLFKRKWVLSEREKKLSTPCFKICDDLWYAWVKSVYICYLFRCKFYTVLFNLKVSYGKIFFVSLVLLIKAILKNFFRYDLLIYWKKLHFRLIKFTLNNKYKHI